MTDKVTSSDRLWSEECNRVDAADVLDSSGIEILLGRRPYDRAYEFSNGRKFSDKPNPYSDPAQ